MIRDDENFSIRQFVFGAVSKDIRCLIVDHAAPLQVIQISVKANAPEGDNNAKILQAGQLAIQKGSAGRQFFRQGLVGRWSAADRGGNVGVAQYEPIIAMSSVGLGGKTCAMKDGIHKVSGSIAGKRAARAVRAVRARRQTKDQDASIGIAKSGDRFAPVLPAPIGAAFIARDLLAINYQARTTAAGYYLFI